MLKNYLFGILLLLSAPATLAADSPYIIHLDKAFYVTGEVVWYKLLLPQDQRGKQVVVKAVLTDPSGENLFYTFLESQGQGAVHGYYKVPFDLPTNMYRLSFLGTSAADQQSIVLAGVDLPIYNDGQAIPTQARLVDRPNETAGQQLAWSPDLQVSIELVSDTVRSRNQVQAVITVRDAQGRPQAAQLSVAVNDHALSGPQVLGRPTIIAGQEAAPGQLLDTNIVLRARLFDNAARPVKANVLGVLMPRTQRIHYTRAYEDGRINLQLPDFYGRQAIQFLGLPGENDSIQVQLLTDSELRPQEDLIYTPEIAKYLEWSRQRKKIFQLYTDLEFNLSPDVPSVEPQVLQPDAEVRVADYEPFDNLALFFKEILTPLVFRQGKDGRYEAKMYTNRGRNVFRFLPGQPLFIVDGQATRDGNYIARMKTDQIETIQVFSDQTRLRRQFNVLGNAGVVIINTSSTDITVPDTDADDILLVNGLQPPAQFPVFRPDAGNTSRHRPFFRPQLYWNPELTTDASGKATVDFHQSDATGDFLIRVLIRDAEGRLAYAETTYHAIW